MLMSETKTATDNNHFFPFFHRLKFCSLQSRLIYFSYCIIIFKILSKIFNGFSSRLYRLYGGIFLKDKFEESLGDKTVTDLN